MSQGREEDVIESEDVRCRGGEVALLERKKGVEGSPLHIYVIVISNRATEQFTREARAQIIMNF